jgi:hypothetical protein
MLQTVQLSITDGPYAASVREALCRSCAWRIDPVGAPDPSKDGVLVLDEESFERLPLPLSNPERVVLITHQEPPDRELLAHAWEAGIVSIVSASDPISTVMLAIMAAALRVAKPHEAPLPRGITPTPASLAAPIAPIFRSSGSKRWKNQ